MAVQEAEQERDAHRVSRMGTAEPVSATHIAVHQMQGIDRRLVGRTQTAYQRFEYAAADEIAQSDRDAKTDEDQQDRAPTAKTIGDQSDQQYIERQPGLGTADVPEERICPCGMMTVDPQYYVNVRGHYDV
jgi:hypothetical protein